MLWQVCYYADFLPATFYGRILQSEVMQTIPIASYLFIPNYVGPVFTQDNIIAVPKCSRFGACDEQNLSVPGILFFTSIAEM